MKLLRALFVGLLVFGLACSASAMHPGMRVSMLQGVQTGTITQSSLDNNYAKNLGTCTINRIKRDCVTVQAITRAQVETTLLPSSASGAVYWTLPAGTFTNSPGIGQQIYEARNQYLSNSAAPATQTSAALPAGAVTLWVNGEGSAELSNGTATGCAGTATNGAPVTVTVTAGTCVVAVTGALNAFNLENGAFGTPFMPCVTAPCARAADVVTLIGAGQTAALGAKNFYFVTNSAAGTVPDLLVFGGSAEIYYSVSTKTITYYGAGNRARGEAAAGTIAARFASSVYWGGNGSSVRANGGTIGTNNTPITMNTGTVNLGNGFAYLNGSMGRVAMSRQPSPQFHALAVAP